MQQRAQQDRHVAHALAGGHDRRQGVVLMHVTLQLLLSSSTFMVLQAGLKAQLLLPPQAG